MCSRAVLLKIYHAHESPRDPVKIVSDSVDMEWGLKSAYLTSHSVGTEGAGPGTTLEVSRDGKQMRYLFHNVPLPSGPEKTQIKTVILHEHIFKLTNALENRAPLARKHVFFN